MSLAVLCNMLCKGLCSFVKVCDILVLMPRNGQDQMVDLAIR